LIRVVFLEELFGVLFVLQSRHLLLHSWTRIRAIGLTFDLAIGLGQGL
jgi:hypothetical protein